MSARMFLSRDIVGDFRAKLKPREKD